MFYEFFKLRIMRKQHLMYALWALAGLMALAGMGFAYHHGNPKKTAIVENNFEAARARATREGKVLVVTFQAKWCTPCHIMDEYTYGNPTVSEYISENYILLKVDIDNAIGHQLRLQHSVRLLPTTLFMTAQGEQISRFEEGLGAGRMLDLLEAHNKPEYRKQEIPMQYARVNVPKPAPKPAETEENSEFAANDKPVIVEKPIAKPAIVAKVAPKTAPTVAPKPAPTFADENEDFVENGNYDPRKYFVTKGTERLPVKGFGVQVAFNHEIKWLINNINTRLSSILDKKQLRVHHDVETSKTHTYRVFAGNFASAQQAREFRDNLRDKGLVDCFVVDFGKFKFR